MLLVPPAQADALTFLALRRKLSGKDKDPDAAEPLKRDLDKAARNLANSMPQASKAAEGLAALQGVRDNHVFAALQQALAPGATQQVKHTAGCTVCALQLRCWVLLPFTMAMCGWEQLLFARLCVVQGVRCHVLLS